MKQFFVFIAAAFISYACSAPSAYTVSGEASSEKVYMFENGEAVDSVAVQDGKFLFSGKADQPRLVVLYDNLNRRASTLRAVVILEPGDISVLQGERRTSVTGTENNDVMEAYNSMDAQISEEYYKDGVNRDSLMTAYKEKIKEFVDTQKGFAGLVILDQCHYEMEAKEALSYYDALEESVKGSPMWTRVHDVLLKQVSVLENGYVDFEQELMSGEGSRSLKSVVEDSANKYVLLDFWASWCGPCMHEMPYLKQAYQTYHSKGFEIFASSLDNDAEAWKQAAAKIGMEWILVSDLKGWQNEGAQQYGVQSIPSNYLIECATGKILESGLRGEALIEKLAELLR